MRSYLYYFLFLLICTACGGEGASESQENTADNKPSEDKVKLPRFDRDSAYRNVARQVAFGPRVPNSKAHQNCKNWLISRFKSFGLNVITQDFQATAYTKENLKGTNIIAQINPEKKKRIIFAAHWDCRHIADQDPSASLAKKPIDGADDGASGVGVLLEIGRLIKDYPSNIGVDLICYDVEDYGDPEGKQKDTYALGSQHWSRNLHAPASHFKYGILLDMVGAKNPRFALEAFSMRYAPTIMQKVWKLAQNEGYGHIFISEQGDPVQDDHYYVNTIAGIKMIDIINRPLGTGKEHGFPSHWHTSKDNLSIIDKNTLRAVGNVCLKVIERESEGTF